MMELAQGHLDSRGWKQSLHSDSLAIAPHPWSDTAPSLPSRQNAVGEAGQTRQPKTSALKCQPSHPPAHCLLDLLGNGGTRSGLKYSE